MPTKREKELEAALWAAWETMLAGFGPKGVHHFIGHRHDPTCHLCKVERIVADVLKVEYETQTERQAREDEEKKNDPSGKGRKGRVG